MDFRHYNQQFHKKTKKWPMILIAIVALTVSLFGTIFFAQTTGEGEAYRTISVIEVSGKVSVVKDGIEYRAYPGMLLQEGHELIASSNSYVRLVLDDDKYIKLEAGSRAVFETLGLLGSGKTSIRLERGSIVNELVNPLKEGEQFVVNTPNSVLAVRGTFFRVDLTIAEKGDIKADVMTYGGQVASQRILPTGETVEEEVLINAGYKTAINMTQEDTHYVLENQSGEIIIIDPAPTDKPDEDDGETEAVTITQPITTEEIPTEDLIDVYFAAENGHKLFVTSEEVKKDLEERDVVIEEQQSVYEKVEEVKKEQQEAEAASVGVSNTTSAKIKADDSQPIAKVAEPKPEEEKSESTTNNSVANKDTGSTGLVDGEHVHREKRTATAATCTTAGKVVVTCRDCKEVLETKEIPFGGHTYEDWVVTQEATCQADGLQESSCSTCGEKFTATIAKLEHTEVHVASAEVHSKCSECGEVLSAEHIMTNSAYVAPSCTQPGQNTYACECGYSYSEEIAALGHTEVAGATADAHSKCATCNEVFSTSHEYVVKETKAPTCVTAGEKTHTCECGYTYTSATAISGHTAVKGGTSDAHSKCSVCNEVLSTTHEYVETVVSTSTCIKEGKVTYNCSCGASYSGQIAKKPHDYVATIDEPTDTANGRSYDKCSMCGDEQNESLIVALNATNFPDENFRAYLDNAYNRDGQAGLTVAEINTIKSLNLAGEGFDGEINVDGGYYDLTGIEYLSELEVLSIDYNRNLTELDISGNKKLLELSAKTTGLTKIDLPKNAALKVMNLTCSSSLAQLDLKDTYLENINLQYTSFTGFSETAQDGYIVVPNMATIVDLDLKSTSIDFSTLGDVNSAWLLNLKSLNVASTNLTDESLAELVSYLPRGLESLDIAYHYSMQSVDVSTLTSLKELNLEGFSRLEYLNISNTQMPSLDIYYIGWLKDIQATNCVALKSASFQGCTDLETLNLTDSAITELDLTEVKKITDLTLTNCSSLESLTLVQNNVIESLDLAGCTGLRKIEVADCANLQELLWSSCTALQNIELTNTGLTTINLDGKTNARLVDVSRSTQLTELDVTPCVGLEYVMVADCSNVTRVNAGACHTLQGFDISGTRISQIVTSYGANGYIDSAIAISSMACIKSVNLSETNIYFSGMMPEETVWMGTVESFIMRNANLTNTEVTQIINYMQAAVTELDFSDNTSLTSLDVSRFPTLISLNVSGCRTLSTINISTCTALKNLNISNTAIMNVDLVHHVGLEVLDISGLQITNLSFVDPRATTLVELKVNDTLIESINPANYTALKTLECRNTMLTSFSIGDSKLEKIDLSNNNNLVQVNISASDYVKAVEVNKCSSLITAYIRGNSVIETISASDNATMVTIDVQGNPWLKKLNLQNDTAIADPIVIVGSGEASENLTVLVAGTELDYDHFQDWVWGGTMTLQKY